MVLCRVTQREPDAGEDLKIQHSNSGDFFFVLKRLRTDLTLSTECEDVVSTRSIYYVEEKSTHASVLKDRNPIVYLNRRQPDSIAPHRFSWKMYARNNFSPVRTLSYLLQSQKTKTPQISSN